MFSIEKFKKYLLKKGQTEESLKISDVFSDENINEAIDITKQAYGELTNKLVFEMCYACSNRHYF